MFRTKRKLFVPAFLLAVLLLTAFMTGCGSRQSNTGGFKSRLIDDKGDAVINAKCFSLFNDSEIVYSGLDGSFRLSELPAGLNNIVIQHQDFALEQYQAEVKSDQETVVDFIRLDRLKASNRITNVKVGVVSSTTAEINWQTYKDLACNIHYGTTVSYGSVARDEHPTQTHYYVLTNLEPETLYHFKIQYLDEGLNSYSSYDYSFKTTSAEAPDKPTSVMIRPMTQLGVVDLAWTVPAHADSVRGYNIYRQNKGGSWKRVNGIVVADGLSYSDIEAESGVFCRYAVTAVNGLGAESDMAYTDLTFVPGVVKNDIVITKSDSPVKLTADLIVPQGVNMVIEAGSEIQISEKDSFKSGSDVDRVEIVVHGTLTVNGTENEKVNFSPLDGSGSRTHWAGITILSTTTGVSAVRNANIFGCSGYALKVSAKNVAASGLSVKHSVCGLCFDSVKEKLEVADCVIDDIASIAVSINKCYHITLKDSKITDSYIGVQNFTDNLLHQTYIRNTDIYADTYGITGVFGVSTIANVLVVSPVGLNYSNILNTAGNIVDHVTVDARKAIVVENGILQVKNNILANTDYAGEVGITNNNSYYIPTYNYNNIYGFAKDCVGCVIGTDSIRVDPVFIGGSPFDYRLNNASLLLINDDCGNELGRYGNSKS